MAVDLKLAPKQKRPAGQRCCEPVVYPDVERDEAVRMAQVAKALGDAVRCGWCRPSTSCRSGKRAGT